MNGESDWIKLARKSAQLSDDKVLKIVQMLDHLPADQRPAVILDAIRPKLGRLRPPRKLTAQRLLFNPVEDLFDPPEGYRRQIGRVARWNIHPVWDLVSQRLPAGYLQTLNRELQALDGADTDGINEVGKRLWAKAASILGEALTLAEKDRARGIELFGRDEDTRRQVRDIAGLLAVGFELEQAKGQLPPKPVEWLTEAQSEYLREAVGQLSSRSLDKVRSFTLALAARMLKPGHLLEILGTVSLGGTATAQSEMIHEVEQKVVANLERQVKVLNGELGSAAGPVVASRMAANLFESFESLTSSLKNQNDPEIAAGLRRTRTEIAGFVRKSVIKDADKALFGIIDGAHQDGRAGKSLEETTEQVEQAEAYALTLRQCSRMAPSVGVESDMSQKMRTIRGGLEDRTRHLAEDLEVDENARAFFTAIRLLEILESPDEAQRLMETYGGALGDQAEDDPDRTGGNGGGLWTQLEGDQTGTD